MDLYLFEDTVPAGQQVNFVETIGRAIYVTAGAAGVADKSYVVDEGFVAAGAMALTAGPEGASLWRWELLDKAPDANGAMTRIKNAGKVLDEFVSAKHFIRLDSVSFPPGGVAMLHSHAGPGIRCLREGTIRIDSEGTSTCYGPGGAWFENGPEPVFAQADQQIASRFIRVSILPQAFLGKSSIKYVNEEDAAKPKVQTYHRFGEQLLAL